MAVAFAFPGWKFDTAQAEPGLERRLVDDLADLDDLESHPDTSSDHAEADAEADAAAELPADLQSAVFSADLLFAVFSQLSVRDLCTARAVARAWKVHASGDALWTARWAETKAFVKRPPRAACGSLAFAAPPPRHPRFWQFACRGRASQCYKWMDLQKGWERLEESLQPEALQATRLARGDGSSEQQAQQQQARKLASILASRDWERLFDCVRLLQLECAEAVAASLLAPPQAAPVGGADAAAAAGEEASMAGREAAHLVPVAAAEAEAAETDATEEMETETEAEAEAEAEATQQESRRRGKRPWSAPPVQRAARHVPQPAAAAVPWGFDMPEACRGAGRRVRSRAAARGEAADAEAAAGAGTSGGGEAEAEAEEAAEMQAEEAADELLLQRLLGLWDRYSRWLHLMIGCFSHTSGSACRGHLVCLLAAQRSRDRVDQHTPSLLHAGFGAFRGAVLMQPAISAALRRHVERATASVMSQGGFTPESGRLMQQLLDLQGLLTTLDVRDDHLAEERGGAGFSQEQVREALLGPILSLWRRHGRTWFAGVRLVSEEHEA